MAGVPGCAATQWHGRVFPRQWSRFNLHRLSRKDYLRLLYGGTTESGTIECVREVVKWLPGKHKGFNPQMGTKMEEEGREVEHLGVQSRRPPIFPSERPALEQGWAGHRVALPRKPHLPGGGAAAPPTHARWTRHPLPCQPPRPQLDPARWLRANCEHGCKSPGPPCSVQA